MENTQSWVWPIVMTPEHKVPPPAVVQVPSDSPTNVVAFPSDVEKDLSDLSSRISTAQEISRCFDKEHNMEACIQKFGGELTRRSKHVACLIVSHCLKI